nr:MAG TPA: Cytosine specific methyltransferase [Caudoviricetes sp.]
MDGQVTWSDLGISCGKTWSEPLAATKEKTSQPCWKKLRVSQNQDFLYLDCRESGNGQKQEPSTVMGGLSLGELTTLRTGEKPSETAVQEMLSVWGPHSVAEESRLSQILEVNPLSKYNLTAKACQGILRRAERRGKDLPKLLKAVLIRQSQGASPQERTEAPAPTEAPTSYAVRIRGGCDGGGKGALVQTEKSGTLGTGNDQTIFCMATQQGGAELRTDDRAPTLTAAAGMSGNNQPVVCAGFKLGNSEQARSIGYQEELSPTLNAECGGNKPAVVAPAVALDMTHACDVIRECGEQVPALQARMGTGGNQVPLTYQDVTGTLSPGAHAGSYNGQDAYNDMLVCGASPDVAHALRAKSACAYREDAETYPVQNMVVRRLTPMECERLQGFPDHWTEIGEWIDEKSKKHKDADSPRYKALGNSIALPFWDWMLRRMARYLPKGATLGSLFDGIGGFPLCFERIHGKGTARWASEIEPFPIAVTKRWFGEE